MNAVSPALFQKHLLEWFDKHGRKELPWQQNKTPYSVWVSEIMLQQTQVSTVIPYYLKFMQRFPTLKALAQADENDVLHAWAGLGYYSRARNLHKAAKKILADFAGIFPDSLESLQSLPGIGPSTAGAILALAFNHHAAILDGNVKRVLTRLHGITLPVDDKAIEKQLWEIANHYTPKTRIADYTQAMMDFGATLCTRSDAQCHLCPFSKKCIALKEDIINLVPAKKATKKLPVKSATFLILQAEDTVLLQKRPASGIWGGLYCLPQIDGKASKNTITEYCQEKLKFTVSHYKPLANFRHTFSHYHLEIYPILLAVKANALKCMDDSKQIWYNLHSPEAVGLPKPIQSLLRGLT